jgi:hypothetical protein
MFILPTPETFPLRFGVNFEGGYTPPTYDPGAWVFEIRPVAGWRVANFDIDLNPILDIQLRGACQGVHRPSRPASCCRDRVSR